MRKFLLFLLICLFSSQVFSEQFRVGQIHSVDLQVQPDFKVLKNAKIIDAIAIHLPEDKTFIDAVEIKMEIPESVAYWRDSVACSLYEKISPEPTESQIDYFGNRTNLQVLPGKLSWILQIPLAKDNELKSDQYVTRIQKIPDVSNGFLFVRLHPIMKGMPDEVFEFCRRYNKLENRKTLVAVPSSYNKVTEKELMEHGVNVVIYANQLLRSAYPAMVKTAESILMHSRSAEADADMMPIKQILELIPGGK